MLLEILLGVLCAIVLLYLFYLYVGWGTNWTEKYAKYKINPKLVVTADADFLSKYGWILPPAPLADSYKVFNFWVKYYTATV